MYLGAQAFSQVPAFHGGDMYLNCFLIMPKTLIDTGGSTFTTIDIMCPTTALATTLFTTERSL
jgi:hypothetical protein